jgi:hypothetical protein
MTRNILLLALAMAAGNPVTAAVLTVGPDGNFPSLQAALNVAQSNGEADEIRIQAGLLQTSAQATLAEDFFLEISGGWNASFDGAVDDASATELSGSQSQRVLSLAISAGDVLVRNLTLADGSAADGGAGVDITIEGNATFELARCRVLRNGVVASGAAGGGGVQILQVGNSTVELDRCVFAQNEVSAGTASGGGLQVTIEDGSFIGNGLEFFNNIASGTGIARGGAVAISAGGSGDPSVELRRLTVNNNAVDSDSSNVGAGLHLLTSPSISGPFVSVEGALFRRNRRNGSAAGAAQLEVNTSSGNVTLRSVAAVDGIDVSGLRVDAVSSAQAFVINTTAVNNDVDGIRHEDGSSNTQTQYNGIAFGNGAAQFVFGDDGNGNNLDFFNIVGTNPGFVDFAGGNYRLADGSSAIDSCLNSPVGGIGLIDADFGPRVVGSTVDCGAFEWTLDQVFGDRFQLN